MTDIRPMPGAQTRFLSNSADICVFGGSAGSSKTFSLLLEAARHIGVPGYGAVIFRREFRQITSEGGIRDTAMDIYPHMGGIYRAQPTPHFIFPSGAKISFSHLNQESDCLSWQGSQICFIGFDEGTHFSEFQITYLLSRNRSICGVKPLVRITCNPDSDSWLASYLSWWIDQDTGYPIKERSGKIRYMIRVNGERVWGSSREELMNLYDCSYEEPKSVSFVPALITDNPILLKKDPGYLSNLKALSRVERARLLDGNWKVRAAAGMYFPREDARIVDWMPPQNEMIKWVRSWDLAASEESEGRDPDFTVGMLVGRKTNGKLVIGDVIRVRRKAAEVRSLVRTIAVKDGRDVWINLPRDPGQAGKPIYEEELVLMGNGELKKLKDIRVNEYVIGLNARPHRVINTHSQGLLHTVKIITECGRQVIAALDHPFLTPDGWVNAGHLTTSDSLALLCKADVSGKTTRTEEEFRLCGYFIGDGSVGCSSNINGKIKSSNAGFTCNDSVQLEDFIECVESIGGHVVVRGNRGMDYGCTGIQNWLRETEISGKTSYDKRVPSWVFKAPTELVAEFLGAYFACDGFISRDGDEVVFYSVSRELLQDVQSLLLRLGISSTLKQKNGKYLETRHVSYLLRMRQQDDGYRRFANRVPVYHTMKVQRLRDIASKSRYRRFDEEYLPDKIISIEDSGLLPCRCLTVENAESFVVNDIVVHNSQAESFIEMLRGFTVISRSITRNKVTMAEPAAALWQQGNIEVVRGDWNEEVLSEFEQFPEGRHDDLVDAISGAVHSLPGHSRPDYSNSGLSGRFKTIKQERRR